MKRKRHPRWPRLSTGSGPAAGTEGSKPVRKPLSRDEKRLILADIVRLNPLDCLDESGEFDLAKARRVLPADAIQGLTVTVTTRTHKPGSTTVKRVIRLHLIDKLRAMTVDDFLLQQELADRGDTQTLKQRRKLREEQDESIRQRRQDLADMEEREKEEREVRAMKAAETHQEAERLRAAGHEGAPLLLQDWPRDTMGRPIPPPPPQDAGPIRKPHVPPPPLGQEDPNDPTPPPGCSSRARALACLRAHPNHPRAQALERIIE